MKLYTEEQVMKAMMEARLSPWLKIDFLLQDFTPIELPSDEEIDNLIEISEYSHEYDAGFSMGAKWVIEQIKQQSDGK